MPKNIAIKPPIMLSLASWTAKTSSGILERKTVFASFKNNSIKAPDEEAKTTDERIDPFKLWPKVVGKQHSCQDSTKTLMVRGSAGHWAKCQKIIRAISHLLQQ